MSTSMTHVNDQHISTSTQRIEASTVVHEPWCTEHVDASAELPTGWCARMATTHGVQIEVMSDIDTLDGANGIELYAPSDDFLTPQQACMVGAATIEAAMLAAGHGRATANVQRNLIAELTSRGPLLVNDVEVFARMLGLDPVDLFRD